MDKQIKDFNELIFNASDYLESQLHYSVSAVDNYRRCWKQVRNFMALKGIKCYNREVGKQVLFYKFKDRRKAELSTNEKLFFNSIKMLTDFQETGQIKVPSLPRKERIVFKGPIGEIITDFLNKKIEKRLSKCSFHSYHRNLSKFLNYCNQKGITTIKDIDLTIILHFINELSHKNENNTTESISVIRTLRGFMKFAFEQKLLATDYSNKIPRYKSVIQPKLPSVYSKEDVEKLIKSVDRSSPMGKRNYVIILLAARLGLRASDICNLKFDNLHWNTSTIKIEQFKTGKELVLPMLPDIVFISTEKYTRVSIQKYTI